MSAIRIALVVIFFAFPLLEIAVLIKVGQAVGFWPTLAIVVGTAFLGSRILRDQGLAAVRRTMEQVRAGKPPVETMTDRLLLSLAGGLLISPGLISDLLGLALLVPPLRNAFGRWGLKTLMETSEFEVAVFGEDVVKPQKGPTPHRGAAAGGTVIEGEFERLDERTMAPDGRNPVRRPEE